ncbi:MAG: plastocyanin/azurin family copper-binding protein [Anaerolineales bacterium]|nr:plastocyanin/azurin family copper-binding protein [Anaerolineales bacterium]
MKNQRPYLFIAALIVLAVLVSACQAAAPTPERVEAEPSLTPEVETETPEADAEEEEVTPSLQVQDQKITSGAVIIPEAVSSGPGWVVIHADQGGNPGPVIGYAALQSGTNFDVEVQVEEDQVTATLFAMLHTDSGEEGTYEFPEADPPVKAADQVVTVPFQVLGDQASGGEERMVEVLDSKFGPEEIVIQPGTTVVWNQTGSISHTVTADDGLFDSGNMEQGDTFAFTFEEEGTFPYYCVYHGGPGGKGMSGTVIVGGGGEGGTEVEAGEDAGEDPGEDAGEDPGEDETDSLY